MSSSAGGRGLASAASDRADDVVVAVAFIVAGQNGTSGPWRAVYTERRQPAVTRMSFASACADEDPWLVFAEA